MNLKVELESLTLSLNDDTHFLDQPLVQLFIQNANVTMKQLEKEDDAATFILKKMGIFQKRQPR